MRLEEQRVATQRVQRKRQFKGLGLILGGIVVVAGAIAIFSADEAEVDTSGTTTPGTAPGGGDPVIGTTPCPPADGAEERTTTFESGPVACIDPERTYTATVVTSRGVVTIELFADRAPKAVNNFVFLARNHYYDGTAFHRIIPDFVVQGGDPNGDPPGTGGPGYTFADELPTEGPPFYDVGSVAMANPSAVDSNGSQFYIVTGQQGVDLPANYSLFGAVTEGMDVVLEIEGTGSPDGTPLQRTTITSVTIAEG